MERFAVWGSQRANFGAVFDSCTTSVIVSRGSIASLFGWLATYLLNYLFYLHIATLY